MCIQAHWLSYSCWNFRNQHACTPMHADYPTGMPQLCMLCGTLISVSPPNKVMQRGKQDIYLCYFLLNTSKKVHMGWTNLLHVYVPKIFILLFLVLQCTYVTVSMSELQVMSPLAGNCIRSDIWLPWVFSFMLCLIVVFFIQIEAYWICRCRITKFWGGAGGASHDTDVLCTN